MNNQFKNKTVGCGTTPEPNTEMFFCIHMNTLPVALEDCSHQDSSREQIEQQVQMRQVDLKEVNSLKNSDGYEDRLIERQDEKIKVLEKQISNKEQELFEKDRYIDHLEIALDEICELVLEVIHS